MAEMFLELKDIPGESLDKDHTDEIELLSVSWSDNTFGAHPSPMNFLEGRGGRRNPMERRTATGQSASNPGHPASTPKEPTTTTADLDMTADKLKIDEIEIKKICDKASMNLLRYCCRGWVIPEGKITLRKLAGEEKVEYLVIELKGIKISSFNWAYGEDLLGETVKLNLKHFKMIYTPQDNAGNALGKIEFPYEITDPDSNES